MKGAVNVSVGLWNKVLAQFDREISSFSFFSFLQVIFGKSSCPEFSKEAYTAVVYHNR